MSEKPLRILFVNRMASMERGGGETFDLEMMRHLVGLGCQVSVLTGLPLFGRAKLGPGDWWTVGELDDGRGAMGESPIVHCPLPIASHTIRTPYTGWFPWDKVRGGWRLRVLDFQIFEWAAARWACKNRDQYDVIQVCELPFFVKYFKDSVIGWGNLLGRRGASKCNPASVSGSSIPVVLRLTAPDFYDPMGALALADAVIASGTTMRVVRAGPRPDCHDIANGVDTDLFRPHASPLRREQGWADDDKIVVFVARFQAVKNHSMLLEAFRQLLDMEPKARLVLAGSGPLESSMRKQCAAQGIAARVDFLGEVPFRRVADLYAVADLNAISSDYESFSFVALEGMASALPLVATATDWVPTLIGGSGASPGEVPGGIVVPKGAARPMAEAMAYLLRDSEAARRKGAWNRQRVVRDFGWKVSAGKLLNVYQSLAHGID